MKQWKKVMTMGLIAAMTTGILFTGCGKKDTPVTDNAVNDKTESTDTENKDTSAAQDLSVEIVAKGFQHDFWQAVIAGTKKAEAEINAKEGMTLKTNFVGPANESAIAEQVEQINNAINKNPNAICLAALDVDAAQDAIANAQSKNIPIVGFDSGVPGAPEGAVKANAATDNYAAGEMAAEKMFEVIKDKVTNPASPVRIGVVAQEANSESITLRTKGFVEKMTALVGEDKSSVEGHDKYNRKGGSDIIIEVRIPAEVSDSAGKTEALTLLNKNDLVAIYGSNEFAAKCIINANEGMNKLGADKVIAVGFDSGALQMDAVKNGIFYGSVTQDPVSIGYNAVMLAVNAALGEAVADVDTGCQWYNAQNMDAPEIAPCLYE